jgi:hypothetical protein
VSYGLRYLSYQRGQIWFEKGKTDTKKLSQNAKCHYEHSEESPILPGQTLRFAQGDSFEIISKEVGGTMKNRAFKTLVFCVGMFTLLALCGTAWGSLVDLVAYWTFDEGSGTIAHDSAGSNDGGYSRHSMDERSIR